MTCCNHCGRRLGLAMVSLGIFRRIWFCSAGCKRLYRARWVTRLSAIAEK
jgi:hypothetical protein